MKSFLFRNGANDGFHEGIGDTIALSITPTYLKKVGIVDNTAVAESPLRAGVPRSFNVPS